MMHFSSTPLLLVPVFALLVLTTISLANAVEIGDQCGVNGADFLDDSFTGNWSVAGDGCSIEDATGCYCSPILGDADPLGEWVWQCLSETPDAIPFGPASGKVCPSEMPVPVGFVAAEGEKNPSCDSSNPTGQAGDPPCTYSTCDEGGDLTAVCGCVDLTFGQGPDNQGDLQWFCLHSTCACGDGPVDSDGAETMLNMGIATAVVYALLLY